ncbi:hypothetical protein KQR54_18675, partial [Mycobacterium gordonae]|nr:hypothetical protein [Mycobacterium gordonae]
SRQILTSGGLSGGGNLTADRTIIIADGGATDVKIGNRTVADTTAPTGDTAQPGTLFSWFAYMIKSITGKSTWRTAPAKTLEDLNNHIGAGGAAHADVIAGGSSGFMSGADKTKLDGVATGANNYVHPSSHPPSIIVQDASNRFMTDTERSKLSGIEAGAEVNDVSSVAGKIGVVTLVNGDVGLGNVDNVQQAPLSTYNAHLADYIRQPGYGTTAGSANTYTLTLSPALGAYAAGVAIAVMIHTANTGAATINVNGLGTKSILDSKGNALTSGKLALNSVYTLRYNGTAFILQGEGGEYGTAVAADVLTGKTVGTDSGIVSGSMPNRAGDTAALASSVSGTTLKLRASNGYRDGVDDNVTITDADFIAANILSGKDIFGLVGTLVRGRAAASGTVTRSGTTATYNQPGGLTLNTYSATVTGLDFPNGIETIVIFGAGLILYTVSSTYIRYFYGSDSYDITLTGPVDVLGTSQFTLPMTIAGSMSYVAYGK